MARAGACCEFHLANRRAWFAGKERGGTGRVCVQHTPSGFTRTRQLPLSSRVRRFHGNLGFYNPTYPPPCWQLSSCQSARNYKRGPLGPRFAFYLATAPARFLFSLDPGRKIGFQRSIAMLEARRARDKPDLNR